MLHHSNKFYTNQAFASYEESQDKFNLLLVANYTFTSGAYIVCKTSLTAIHEYIRTEVTLKNQISTIYY